MTKPILRTLVCLCLLLPVGASAHDADDKPYSDIFVFGDSLSDTGNLAAFGDFFSGLPIGTNGLCNPADTIFSPPPRRGCGDLFFEESRVSNGPVAVEVLAKRLGFDELKPSLFFLPLADRPFVGTNYAVAGATARKPDIEHLASQVSGFLVDREFSAPPDALYVVIIGGNDIIDAVKEFINMPTGSAAHETSESIIAAAVDAIGDNIDYLIGQGARKILVVNSVNIGSVPAVGMEVGVATVLTKEFNRQLAERLGQVRGQLLQGLEIKEFNLFGFFEVVRILGKLFGVFVNVDDACFDSATYRDSPTAPRAFHPDCEPEAGPDELPKFDRFVFFDDLHPTGLAHRIIGGALAAAARQLIHSRRRR